MVLEENFYTYRLIRQPSNIILQEYNSFMSQNEPTSAQIAKVEYHMTLGHEHYHARRYQEALNEYKTALGLIYQLMEPTFVPGIVLGTDMVLDIGPALCTPMLTTMFSVMDQSSNTVIQGAVNPTSPIDEFINPASKEYRYLGIGQIVPYDDLDPEIQHVVELGDGHMTSGQYAQAAGFYSSALEQIRDGEQRILASRLHHNLGIAQAERGEIDSAVEHLDKAQEIYTENEAHACAAIANEQIATIHTRDGHYERAVSSLDKAEKLYEKQGSLRTVTPHRLRLAGTQLRRNRVMLETIRNSVATESTTMSTLLAFPALYDTDTFVDAYTASDTEVESVAMENRVLRLLTGVNEETSEPVILEVALSSPDRVNTVIESVYQARVGVKTLATLGMYSGAIYTIDYFRIHVPHHYFFTLQMCLGDCYKALGQYEKALEHYENARDYEYLNVSLEGPNVWLKIAECLLSWGYSYYRNNESEKALEKFQEIVILSIDGILSIPDPSPLYNKPPFTTIEESITQFLPTIDDEAPLEINHNMEIVIRQAIVYQRMIHAGLNVLGLPHDLIPIFRYQYLEAVARYFAEQAIKTEREYINFMASAERETASLLQLQQAVDLAKETVKLEEQRVLAAEAQVSVALESKELAEERTTNAEERKDQYNQVSSDITALDTAIAHASGGFTKTTGGYTVYLSTTGQIVYLGDKDYEIMREAARQRGQILQDYELDNMQRTIDEYTQYVAVAQAQLNLVNVQKIVAKQNRLIADLRVTQGLENLEYAQDKTFNAEMWYSLAERLRDFSELYLLRATEIGWIMQAAYNFEMDTDLRVINTFYSPADSTNDMLGGDSLLADINYFTYHYITQTKKKEIPIKSIISLANKYAYSMYEFRRTGIARFETKLADFDRMFPGTYMRKIKALEVVIEGLVGADGITGSIKNLSISIFRTSDGEEKIRLQPSEVAHLSSYNLKGDITVFQPSQETLGLFEASGVSTAWTIEIPPGSNDLRYDAVYDIKLVLYYTAFHDPVLEQTIRDALPSESDWSRGFSLRDNYPDTFFYLIEKMEAEFETGTGDFPYNHQNPVISRIALFVLPEEGYSAEGVNLKISNEDGGHEVVASTGANGTVTSDDDAAVLNVFVGDSALNNWRISIDPAENPDYVYEADDGTVRIKGIRDIVLYVDYHYHVRNTIT